mmetsp:Transcript_36496/g.117185  ORF Transcript_36496/g.117185 Transcript_36496/m.117185 type:complete len:390 (+) Transcript_36496:777-1946(+)
MRGRRRRQRRRRRVSTSRLRPRLAGRARATSLPPTWPWHWERRPGWTRARLRPRLQGCDRAPRRSWHGARLWVWRCGTWRLRMGRGTCWWARGCRGSSERRSASECQSSSRLAWNRGWQPNEQSRPLEEETQQTNSLRSWQPWMTRRAGPALRSWRGAATPSRPTSGGRMTCFNWRRRPGSSPRLSGRGWFCQSWRPRRRLAAQGCSWRHWSVAAWFAKPGRPTSRRSVPRSRRAGQQPPCWGWRRPRRLGCSTTLEASTPSTLPFCGPSLGGCGRRGWLASFSSFSQSRSTAGQKTSGRHSIPCSWSCGPQPFFRPGCGGAPRSARSGGRRPLPSRGGSGAGSPLPSLGGASTSLRRTPLSLSTRRRYSMARRRRSFPSSRQALAAAG